MARYYAESDVRAAVPAFGRPRADNEGFVTVADERYGTADAWSDELGISIPSIRDRLSETDAIDGISRSGNRAAFFSESLVRAACADFIEALPTLGPEGFVEIGDLVY